MKTKPNFSPLILRLPRGWTKRSLLLIAVGVTVNFAVAQMQQRWTPEQIIQNTSLRLPPEQIVGRLDNSDPKALEWAKFGITHSRDLEKLGDPLKTPDERAREESVRTAILHPEAYRQAMEAAGRGLTAEEQAVRAIAIQGILRPIESARQTDRLKSAADRDREEMIKQAILNPRAFNELVARLKTPAQSEQEARSRKAVLDPQAFNKELPR